MRKEYGTWQQKWGMVTIIFTLDIELARKIILLRARLWKQTKQNIFVYKIEREFTFVGIELDACAIYVP